MFSYTTDSRDDQVEDVLSSDGEDNLEINWEPSVARKLTSEERASLEARSMRKPDEDASLEDKYIDGPGTSRISTSFVFGYFLYVRFP